MGGFGGKKRDFGEEASASGDDGLRPQDLIYIFYFFLFFPCNGTNADLSRCTLDLVIARAFMPVAIRSLNGYYGFLDSLRSLEMTTVTEQMPIYRAVSNFNPAIVGEGLDPP